MSLGMLDEDNGIHEDLKIGACPGRCNVWAFAAREETTVNYSL